MSNKWSVFELVSHIPKGKVVTYGQLAQISGIKNPRVVGNLLHQNQDPDKIPCHRVVNAEGKVAQNYAFGGADGQIQKLKSEGVQVVNGRVEFPKYLWSG